MNKERVIRVRIGEVILYSKGLVIVKLENDHHIELDDVKEHIEAAVKLTNGSDFVIILDGGLTLDVSESAMNFAAKMENKNWLAFAIIVRSISERLFANYFLKFKRPVRPTKVFTTPKGAEKWLGQFITIEGPVKYRI